VSTGTYGVPQDEGGMYALVFDNTFAKSFSKTATFVLLTYPTKSPPQSNHHMHHFQGASNDSAASLDKNLSAREKLVQQSSADSVQQVGSSTSDIHRGSDESRSRNQGESESSNGSNFFNGILQKRRRKRHQGWARRFFSLDYTTSTLSYYHNRNTLALRGAVPLSLAAVGANAKTRQISIDSGAEIWHLKALSQKDFEAWKNALELARTPIGLLTPTPPICVDSLGRRVSMARVSPDEERDWARAELLANKVKNSREAARTLAKDTDPKYLPLDMTKASLHRLDSNPISTSSSLSNSPSEQSTNGYFNDGADRKPFWKRKPGGDRSMPGMWKRSVSATPSITSQINGPTAPIRVTSVAAEQKPVPTLQSLMSHAGDGVHEQCMALLRDLDSIVGEFDTLLRESKQRRMPTIPLAVSRHSIDSQGSDEFFDAEGFNNSQLLAIHHESDEAGEGPDQNDLDSASESEVEEPSSAVASKAGPGSDTAAFPKKPSSLAPLPLEPVIRRTAVPPPIVSPPSLIGFLRKNVGKDFSTLSMPVTANEPISALQRIAETLEYAPLLSTASCQKTSLSRLLHITAFAISTISNQRVKERALRKPFNPMLGETFELVHPAHSYRFLAEKISHRPMHFACQADHESWSLTHSPLPTQKFWGKSAELVTEGKLRIALHATGDRFSWTPATTFLRNILAGEKYTEPVGSIAVLNESTGEKALVSFKSKGMFSGRSEDIIVQTFSADGEETPMGLAGKWTTSLSITENGHPTTELWSVDPLPPDAAKRYGFTTFAASINESTKIEEGKLPTTDSRLRPDQRAYEEGDIDAAEAGKARLEEAQRKRRKALEDEGVEWMPRWFERVEGGDGEESWVLKRGGYWDRRGRWEGVEGVF